MTRRGMIIGAGAALLLALVVALGWRGGSLLSVTESTERASYYFRLKASYTHAGEPIDFDIVAACNIRVDRYRSGDSGFLAVRFPRFFVKETHDGHAVMQIVPIACRGETTADGRVSGDFLPGVIWFDKPGDYRFGIAYVSEDAFNNANGQLKFHGASIEKATHEEWEQFRNRAQENVGIQRRYYDGTYYSDDEIQKIDKGRTRQITGAYLAGDCRGVFRFKLTESARAVVRNYWPATRPKFWATTRRDNGPWPELRELEKKTRVLSDGLRYTEHFRLGSYEFGGFPTHARGGMLHSAGKRLAPSDIFPAKDYEGAPWAFTEAAAQAQFLVKDIDIDTGPGRGFLYCYSTVHPPQSGVSNFPLPNFRKREKRIRVDGEWVVRPPDDRRGRGWPSPFFERDEYMYFGFVVRLS